MGSTLISAIIPTIGRAESLTRLLDSLAAQITRPDEILVADGSDNDDIDRLVHDARWSDCGLRIKRIAVHPPNAVRQRQAAIAVSSGELLLLLDDDVELEPECIQQMVETLDQEADVVAVTADFNNQSWSQPTRAWRIVLKLVYGIRDGQWQGRVIGPLLRFGYNPSPKSSVPMEWLGSGNSLIRSSTYKTVGGFSNFFLHRCTMNEDVDLGLKLNRVGRILFCPTARMAHWHAPEGRVPAVIAAEDDLHNRFQILRRTIGYGWLRSFGLVLLYFAVETTSSLAGGVRRMGFDGFALRLIGRARAIAKILFPNRAVV